MPETMQLLGDSQDCLNLALAQDTVFHMPGTSQSTHLCGLVESRSGLPLALHESN